MSLLAGRHALVTGAANGIGQAIAERFRAEGATVSGVDVEEGVEYRFDLSRVDELGGLVDRVEGDSGPVDVLCSAAGVFEPTWAVDMTVDLYRSTLAVNLDAPVLLGARCGGSMAERGYGRILSITSIHGGAARAVARLRHLEGGPRRRQRTLAHRARATRGARERPRAGVRQTRMSIVDAERAESEWFETVYRQHRKPRARPREPAETSPMRRPCSRRTAT